MPRQHHSPYSTSYSFRLHPPPVPVFLTAQPFPDSTWSMIQLFALDSLASPNLSGHHHHHDLCPAQRSRQCLSKGFVRDSAPLESLVPELSTRLPRPDRVCSRLRCPRLPSIRHDRQVPCSPSLFPPQSRQADGDQLRHNGARRAPPHALRCSSTSKPQSWGKGRESVLSPGEGIRSRCLAMPDWGLGTLLHAHGPRLSACVALHALL